MPNPTDSHPFRFLHACRALFITIEHRHGQRDPPYPSRSKLLMYRVLQFVIVFAILARFVMLSFGGIYGNSQYVIRSAQEAIDLVIISVLWLAFRLRKESPFAPPPPSEERPFELAHEAMSRAVRAGMDLSAQPTLDDGPIRQVLALHLTFS